MGFSRKKPARLGEKLKAVREKFGYSLAEMATALSDDELYVYREEVFRFEKDTREPSLLILLRYARLSKLKIDDFADDKTDLPL